MGPNQAMVAAGSQAASQAAQQSNQHMGTMYAITSAVSALSTLAGGFSQMQAAGQESQYMEAQAQLIEAESKRDAIQKAREVRKFRATQAHRFASSGITLEGSPALVLEETRRLGKEEVDSILKRGQAQSNLARIKARMTRSSGRSAMFGSILGGLGSAVERYTLGRRVGLFGNIGSAPVMPGGNPQNPATPLPPIWNINPALGGP